MSDPRHTEIDPGTVLSYQEMCSRERASLQRGMNYRLDGVRSIFLMSRRPNAPYSDEVQDEGLTIIYEGHDEPRREAGPDPKTIDQPLKTSSGRPTQNGLFWSAAKQRGAGHEAEIVIVYEKVLTGIWVYNGLFRLVDAWLATDEFRSVCKFRLVSAEQAGTNEPNEADEATRVIPSLVKREVWKRDKGRCRICGRDSDLHFDHIIPFSKGGSSRVAENIQLLCATHNLQKHDRIE